MKNYFQNHRLPSSRMARAYRSLMFTILLGVALGAWAQDEGAVENSTSMGADGAVTLVSEDDFEVRWTPYLWAAGIKGTSGMGG